MQTRGLCVLIVLLIAAACSPNGSVPVDGQLSDRVQRAVDLGRVAPDAELDFVVGLSLRHETKLRALVRDRLSSEEGLAPERFADGFAPSRSEYASIVRWLGAGGATVTRQVDGRTTVSAHATAAVVEGLFSVELHRYEDAQGSFVAAASPIRVAPDLLANIVGVVGLSGASGWKSHLVLPDLNAGARLLPSDMQALYGTSSITNPGMGETVAILGAGNAPDPTADVGGYMKDFKPYGITTAQHYSQFLLGGPNRDAASLASQEYYENVLDAEMVLAMAPLANVVHVIVATNTPGMFSDGLSYIVNQHPEAHTVSVSYGSCERGQAQEAAVINTLLEQALAQGQTWFFASGDTGTDGCRDGSGNMHIAAGWPASSPFAVGVGGTMIGAGGVEVTWNQNSVGNELAGGGGPSEIFPKPTWQQGKTPSDGARDTPDIAAIAGGGGVWINVGTMHGGVLGTSVATPVCAGAWALVDQGKGGNGISDALTKIYALGGVGFNDITAGDNGGPNGISPGYPAGPGYDLATGWGTPNVAKLIANLP